MVKVLSLFSGIGAFEKALTNLNIPYELVGFSEIDKYASVSYCAIHNVSPHLNLGDITQIDENSLPKDIDLITYGFPCQDISMAGNQKGFFNEDNSKTRSGLFFDALRIIEATQPKIAIAENVKALTYKNFSKEFELVKQGLDEAGYNNYYQVMNGRNYGIPQNRERVFIVSIRKDIDNGSFKFPSPIELPITLKDLLEENVDEKYFLTKEQVEKIKTSTYNQNKTRVQEKDWCDTLCARDFRAPKCVKVADFRYDEGLRIRKNNLSPTFTRSLGQATLSGQPLIIGSSQKNACINTEGISPCLTSSMGSGGGNVPIHNYQTRIRKLTPTESFKLMGFTKEDCDKARAKLNETFYKGSDRANSQLYKQAGNSIIVNVVEFLLQSIIKFI